MRAFSYGPASEALEARARHRAGLRPQEGPEGLPGPVKLERAEENVERAKAVLRSGRAGQDPAEILAEVDKGLALLDTVLSDLRGAGMEVPSTSRVNTR